LEKMKGRIYAVTACDVSGIHSSDSSPALKAHARACEASERSLAWLVRSTNSLVSAVSGRTAMGGRGIVKGVAAPLLWIAVSLSLA
jgi:hypothetical protein